MIYRFFFIHLTIALTFFPLGCFALSMKEEKLLSYVNKSLEKWQSFEGDFLQHNPDGRKVKGTIAVKRPGRLRMDYHLPLSMKVISDGVSVMVQTNEEAPVLHYPISITPLPDLFGLSHSRLQDVATILSIKQRDGRIMLLMREEKHTGVEIQVFFDISEAFALIGWIAKDLSGETLVILENMRYNIPIPGSFFTILTNKQ